MSETLLRFILPEFRGNGHRIEGNCVLGELPLCLEAPSLDIGKLQIVLSCGGRKLFELEHREELPSRNVRSGLLSLLLLLCK